MFGRIRRADFLDIAANERGATINSNTVVSVPVDARQNLLLTIRVLFALPFELQIYDCTQSPAAHTRRGRDFQSPVDEMVVRIAGQRMYLWRAVDHEGEVLDMLVAR